MEKIGLAITTEKPRDTTRYAALEITNVLNRTLDYADEDTLVNTSAQSFILAIQLFKALIKESVSEEASVKFCNLIVESVDPKQKNNNV